MDESIRKIFPSRFRFFLERKGKTQIDISRDLDVATGTVSSWANGQKLPRVDVMQRLADYFGVRVSTLLEEDGLDVYLREEDDRAFLAAYHAADPSIQAAVRKLLDIPEKSTISNAG